MIPLRFLLPAIAGLMVVEVAVMLLQPRARRMRCLPSMMAGFFVVLAWNASAFGLALPLVLACLGVALVAHGADLVGRW